LKNLLAGFVMTHHFLFYLDKNLIFEKKKKTLFEYFNLHTIYNVIIVKAAKAVYFFGRNLA